MLTEYDRKLLRHINDPLSEPDLSWGAAMGASLEYLREEGYLSGYNNIKITSKGKDAIQSR